MTIKPYLQRCIKILTAESAAEAESIINGMFEEFALNGEDLPDVQLVPAENGSFTIIIYSYLKVEGRARGPK